MQAIIEVDVLICGGGPVGLLIGYCLARNGVSTYIVEQHERAKQSAYGRAAMIAPRTLEMLDQLDLADALGQIGFVVRGQVSYKNGEPVENLTAASSNIEDTFFDYLLLCRQRYTEDVIRDSYARVSGKKIHYGARLVDFAVGGKSAEYGVRSTIESRDKGRIYIRSKYVIGADGGRSTIRGLAGIAFQGEKSNRHWIRIDGVVETNMPEARKGICGITSQSHGSVLWACLDHGVTRVGFALPEKLWDEIGADISEDDVIREAQKALQPFTLEFRTVDWWTVYSVGQRLAADYRKDERIFIAGDAAHTHSSGAAQGMNTGLHDAVNLSWKLAGCINGWLSEEVLDTYAAERRPIAQRIIDQDKIISVATGGEIPEQFKDHPGVDAHSILTKTYKKNTSLNTGLGIVYPTDDLTVVVPTASVSVTLQPGERAPDVLVQRPGLCIPLRLHSVTKNGGKFTITLFCGDPSRTRTLGKAFRGYLDGSSSFLNYSADIFQGITILAGSNDAGSPDERLGTRCFGNAFYDVDGRAHERYGVSTSKGAVVVTRPDGTIGTVCALDNGASLSRYFEKFVI
ncbi:FAD binding domain-containing protein, partial [Usnea florida]